MTEELRALTTGELKKLRVLIVDPNVFMRGVVADSLRRLQVTHIAAGTTWRAFKVK